MNNDTDPHISSRLVRDTLALVLAGGRGPGLHELTAWRAQAGLFFGGQFRLIDFALSNCVNSGIRRIGVLTQYKAHSLIRHLVNGWSFMRRERGEFMEIMPASQRTSGFWYRGTADAIRQNLDTVFVHQPGYVLILPGDHVYKMDYGALLAYHREKQAEMTIAYAEVPLAKARAFGIMNVDQDSRVTEFVEKPEQPWAILGNPEQALASMGIYVFNRETLIEKLSWDADDTSAHDFGKDIIPALIDGRQVFAYRFGDSAMDGQPYWRDVGSVDNFWEANMDLVAVNPQLDLYNQEWPVLTNQRQLPPASFIVEDESQESCVANAVVAGGCVFSGSLLQESMLFSNVRVHAGASIDASVVLPDVEIGKNCRIRKAIIDRGCRLADGMVIGEDPQEDAKNYRVSADGVVLVTPPMLAQRLKPWG